MGGEKHQDESSVMELQGSPPRGRGKGPHHKYCHPFHRITPAWAGKSGTNNRPGGCTGDHPRVGGEKSYRSLYCGSIIGSPPRGRGKGKSANGASGRNRITPAWAGKRTPSPRPSKTQGDHPRVGGEKVDGVHIVASVQGSPPRGRGKGISPEWGARREGITPAWAGKSSSVRVAMVGFWDHPRVGGEKTKKIP